MTDTDALHHLAGASGIVFDWNGTVVNDTERAIVATNRVLRDLALPELSASQFRDAFRLPLDRFFLHLGALLLDIPEAIAAWNQQLIHGPVALSAGIDALLDTARALSLPVGIVSAASAGVVRADAERLGIADRLDQIVGEARVKSDALRMLSARFGGRLVYAGDTEYDIEEAKAAGAIAVAFGGGYRPIEQLRLAKPDLVVNDFAELAGMLHEANTPVAQNQTSISRKGYSLS